MINKLVTALAVLCVGLLAGAMVYGSIVVRGGFYASPVEVHLRYRAAFIPQNTPLMPGLMIIGLLLCGVLAVLVRGRLARGCAAAAAALLLACFLVTMLGNVPINDQIVSWAPASPPLDYLSTLGRWDLLHDIRTAAVLGAFALIVTVALDTPAAVPRTRPAWSVAGLAAPPDAPGR